MASYKYKNFKDSEHRTKEEFSSVYHVKLMLIRERPEYV
jgi:hypothetical protein